MYFRDEKDLPQKDQTKEESMDGLARFTRNSGMG